MDLAPPPYSETDEYSSNAGTSIIATTTATGSTTQSISGRASSDGVVGCPPPSTSSSADKVIFTPPYSPTSSSYATTDQDHLLSSSAAAYFEARPATIRNTAPPVVYRITVTPDTQPQDLPFPESFRSHGVLDQDWLTFLNYLLSDFIYNASREPTDRKEKGVQREGNNKVDVTIGEWNEGFFKPRGLQITTHDVEEEIAVEHTAEVPEASKEPAARVPGAWIPHDHIPYDHEILGASSAGRKRGFFSGFKPFQASQQGGFRMGPIVADNDGFRMGNMIVADQNGFRLGSKTFIPRKELPDYTERGRSLGSLGQQLKKTNRSLSVSSVSSSASGSSIDSESSVGSLPEYDDLRDQQLPLAKQSLLNWLSQSDQPLTKVSVQQIRDEIQSARNASSHNEEHDIAQLRREVKDLMKEFRESKKKQKRDQRQARRERRATKRAHKAERRTAKREARRLKREGKSCKGKEVRRPPWMTSRSTVELEQPPPMPPRPTPPEFTRAASVPSIRDAQFNGPSVISAPDPVPGITTQLHCTWPYTRNAPYSPGTASPILPGTFPTNNAFADSSETLYAQAKELERTARTKEELAIELRTEATGLHFGEKDRLKKFDQASALEEEAEKEILEADRLRAEALHLDGELARELEESSGRGQGQTAGVVMY